MFFAFLPHIADWLQLAQSGTGPKEVNTIRNPFKGFALLLCVGALALAPALGFMLLPSATTSPPGLVSVWELDYKSKSHETEKRLWLNPARAALRI